MAVIAGPVSATAAPEAGRGLVDTVILDEPGLVAVLSGRDLEGVYADATPWAESYYLDGTLSYRDRLGLWAGDWSASNGRFCTFYRNQGINGGCFLVAKRGTNCFDFYALDTALRPGATSEEIFAGRNWTARGWYVEAESSCPADDRQIVDIDKGARART
ncbi:hypothetical protein GTK09_15105 [Jiella sp. 40Bstr34]|uniref:Uncharacterized protein n=2 Tax=Jiella pacifica TaxID=2696469 RepID=A0A6N9T598_9HYPH|nr:hypothetical protein [Jiella pacifica]